MLTLRHYPNLTEPAAQPGGILTPILGTGECFLSEPVFLRLFENERGSGVLSSTLDFRSFKQLSSIQFEHNTNRHVTIFALKCQDFFLKIRTIARTGK